MRACSHGITVCERCQMTMFRVNEERLRKYGNRYPEPKLHFVANSTTVKMEIDEHLIIHLPDEMGGSVDESVNLKIEGHRTFGGVVTFDLTDLKMTGLKDEKAGKYFVSIMQHLLNAFQNEICACGGLVDCHCEKSS